MPSPSNDRPQRSSLRALRCVLLASIVAAGAALTACDSNGGGRPGAPKSSTSKKSTAKNAPNWDATVKVKN